MKNDKTIGELLEKLSQGAREVTFDYDCSDTVMQDFQTIMAEHPELFWLTGSCRYGKSVRGNEVRVTLVPEIMIDDEELNRRRKAFDRAVDAFVSACRSDSEFETVLKIHDAIIDKTEYNFASANALSAGVRNDEAAVRGMSAYACLVDGHAVCSGYAKAFQVIASKLGIRAGRVHGIKLDGSGPHEWNIVTVNGQPYHLDVTWDDPVFAKGVQGFRSYDYFCVTTEEILRTHGIDRDSDAPLCTATESNYFVKKGWCLDWYEFEKAADVIRSQLGSDTVYLKFPDKAALDEAAEDLFKKQRVFEIREVLEKYNSLQTSTTVNGTLAIRFLKK
ncbi:MAG: hypothetical protein E7576_02885 [Ruminococcaceae bacterium]|nr:hypothetical protein [Oscillospiraceae bacterium]